MSLQQRHDCPVALRLQDQCIYLASDGAMRSHGKTVEFFKAASNSPELMDGRTLALHYVNDAHDVHYPTWEMHPEGDELLIVTSGCLSVECRAEEREQTARLPSHAAFIVPAGMWHRLIVHEPSVLIAITKRRNTVHDR